MVTDLSSIIGNDQPPFLRLREIAWGWARLCKPPQGAALISMREHPALIGWIAWRTQRDVRYSRALIGLTAYVHLVTYATVTYTMRYVHYSCALIGRTALRTL